MKDTNGSKREDLYVLVVRGGIEIERYAGPLKSQKGFEKKFAEALRATDSETDGVFGAVVDAKGRLHVWSVSGGWAEEVLGKHDPGVE